MNEKKIIKPDKEEKLETNGSGGIGHGSGVTENSTHKTNNKISKSLIIVVGIILLFVLALIIL